MPPGTDPAPTARLLLRRWRDSDRGPFAELNADPQVMRYFPATMGRPASDALADRIEARFAQYGYGLWAVEIRATGEFIGFTGLNPMPPIGVSGTDGMEIGWRLARRAWHQGYATEAARAVLAAAFGPIGLDQVWSMTAVRNEPSIAVMRRLGMLEAARFEHPGVPAGSPVRPHVLYHLARPS